MEQQVRESALQLNTVEAKRAPKDLNRPGDPAALLEEIKVTRARLSQGLEDIRGQFPIPGNHKVRAGMATARRPVPATPPMPTIRNETRRTRSTVMSQTLATFSPASLFTTLPTMLSLTLQPQLRGYLRWSPSAGWATLRPLPARLAKSNPQGDSQHGWPSRRSYGAARSFELSGGRVRMRRKIAARQRDQLGSTWMFHRLPVDDPAHHQRLEAVDIATEVGLCHGRAGHQQLVDAGQRFADLGEERVLAARLAVVVSRVVDVRYDLLGQHVGRIERQDLRAVVINPGDGMKQ